MVIFITGASHTGKTALSQKLLEQYKVPYLSIDHLKMGLIRSGNTTLTPLSEDEALTAYLWPIVRQPLKMNRILLWRGAIFLSTGRKTLIRNIWRRSDVIAL